ncbi:MAG TPA: alpha/beta hydrolase [Dongiaceae bacterium]|jgi:pimeloyl-ACP methyl ester carboxylesterase|nr:alpha/beta hydrolase [Dongiaceae bacterium]
MQQRTVVSPDGLALAAYEAGNPSGPEILFIHGFSQCSLCWAGQFTDPLLKDRFRLAAFDLRGHGASDKPAGADRYAKDRLFADDVKAVMDALGLERPILVGWSYAGRIVGDYLEAYGTTRLAGINYVCARTNNDAAFVGRGNDHLAGMMGADPSADLEATRLFVQACFAKEQPHEMIEQAVAYNMLVPAHIRAAHLSRPPSDGAVLRKIDVPVLVTQGDQDLLVLKGLGELTATLIPGARLSIYEGIGHTPFIEDAARFNRELAAFAIAANEGRP